MLCIWDHFTASSFRSIPTTLTPYNLLFGIFIGFLSTFNKNHMRLVRIWLSSYTYRVIHVAWCPQPLPQSKTRSFGWYLPMLAMVTMVHRELNGLPHIPFGREHPPSRTRRWYLPWSSCWPCFENEAETGLKFGYLNSRPFNDEMFVWHFWIISLSDKSSLQSCLFGFKSITFVYLVLSLGTKLFDETQESSSE